MKKLVYCLLIVVFITGKINAVKDTLFIYYLENYPYSYTENKIVKGIEVDVINEYVSWAKTDGIDFIVVYKSFDEFDKLFDAVKKAQNNVIGLGSVTIKADRLKDVSFSPPYLKNVSIMISDGKIPNIKSKTELPIAFANFKAVTLKNSVYEKYLNDLKKKTLPKLKIVYTDSEFSAIDSVAKNPMIFAYCDILSYWTYTKTKTNRPIKIQRSFTVDTDNLGLIIPKKSKNEQMLSEFFESEGGFIASSKYKQILVTHLSDEVIELVKVR